MYTRIELRVILIGDFEVGKKSIVKRFKMINASELKILSNKEENNNITIESKEKNKNKNNNNNNNILITELNIKKSENEIEKIDNEEINMRIKREEKRMNLMNFSLIYKIRMNYFEIKFFPCLEAIPLEYDYESKEEDDELYELEKEYKFTLRPLIKEIKDIILSPPENPNNQLEFLFLLCFDLSNIESYKTLLIYFHQIEKKLKISNNFKVALIGNKIDKKISLNKEEKEEINNFRNKIKANYYEISTMMFFPFDKFFELLINDNFKDLPFLTNLDDRNLFHEILMKKNNFSKAERKIGEEQGITGKIKFKYNKDIYEYPSTIKDLMRAFQDPDKFNKNIFLTKIGAALPPVKRKVKDKEYPHFREDQNKILSKLSPGIKINLRNKKIKEALELLSNKPGYSFGFKFGKKNLNLKKQRKALSEARYSALEQFMKENTTQLYEIKKGNNELNIKEIMESQIKYEKNRKELKEKKNEDNNLINEEKLKRFKENLENNEKEEKEKINKILEKNNKYDKKYLKEKEIKEKKRMDNITKNNLSALNNSSNKNKREPKAKFYTPKSYLLTNKGFSFGHKDITQEKIIKKDYPEFPLFKDDFEKILLKNKKILHKSTGERFPEYKAPEIIDDSKLKENQEKYEKKREQNKMNKTIAFNQKRNEFKTKVLKNKKGITLKNDFLLEKFIRRTYKGDNNYLKREINYGQVEFSSPKYSFREKTDFGSIFSKDVNNKNSYNETDNNYYNTKSTKLNTNYIENPNITFTHFNNPKFSFGKSKRFNLTSDNDNSQEKADYYANTDYNYTQSFLKAQTYMGTAKKLELKYNGIPGPNAYKIQRFADDVVEKSKKFNDNNKLKNIDNFYETK